MGISDEKFMDSSPKELEPYEKAHKNKLREMDNMVYMWVGKYFTSAVFTAVEHCLAGRKAQSKYTAETILDEMEKVELNNVEEDKLQKQRELFVAKLQTMKLNFELNNLKKNNEEQENL